uniref:Conserved hypothetical plastid protein n=1 Tax=Olisthodiscus luteus TaxID=83000 RepID=A0A7U0KSI3_OLILU|nr:conserved hypothetical plastid protein [Olisthodiscus luteus]YP_010152829.1 conserved hypothetical plastid protein [Olisthodiscus luteus]QQW50462.1 conserved hypothetical plastid protein [Olisthodiscus luteus]QQW50490.1 conserved hypothetical plastid protein [Olisthodiscus luteus]
MNTTSYSILFSAEKLLKSSKDRYQLVMTVSYKTRLNTSKNKLKSNSSEELKPIVSTIMEYSNNNQKNEFA